MGPDILVKTGFAVDMAKTDQGGLLTDDGESNGEGNHFEAGQKSSMEEEGVTNGGSVKPNIRGDDRPKKRGRPKSSPVKAAGDMFDANGEDIEDNLSTPRKRGRPKGSPKKLIHKTADSDGAVQNTPKRGRPKKGAGKGTPRGRPKKVVPEGETNKKRAADGSESPRKTPGRPKGSRNKAVLTVKIESTSGRPTRVHVAPEKLNLSLPRKKPGKRGRPKKISRGRPRKNPLPPDEELYQPRAWKALGRPRKHPKEGQPEGSSSPETPRRGRGRPRKSESKKGAHLKKLNSKPRAAKEYDGPPRKRGRPKGSVKNKAIVDNSPVDQDSDQNMEDGREEDAVSNSPPCEDNGSNDVLLEDGF